MKHLIMIALLTLFVAGKTTGAVEEDTSDARETRAEKPAQSSPAGGTGVASRDSVHGIAPYPGAKQLGDSSDFLLTEGQNPRWLQYETSDTPAKVIEFYKREADKAGFELKEETDRKLARSKAIKTARPGGGVMNVDTLEQADGKTMINVHISEDNSD